MLTKSTCSPSDGTVTLESGCLTFSPALRAQTQRFVDIATHCLHVVHDELVDITGWQPIFEMDRFIVTRQIVIQLLSQNGVNGASTYASRTST